MTAIFLSGRLYRETVYREIPYQPEGGGPGWIALEWDLHPDTRQLLHKGKKPRK